LDGGRERVQQARAAIAATYVLLKRAPLSLVEVAIDVAGERLAARVGSDAVKWFESLDQLVFLRMRSLLSKMSIATRSR
jgi:hypothetical protein